MAEHTVKAFDEDITRLRGLIAEMGGLAELGIQESLRALVNGDEELAAGVVARDLKLDRLESQVDELAVRVIALRAPMATSASPPISAMRPRRRVMSSSNALTVCSAISRTAP